MTTDARRSRRRRLTGLAGLFALGLVQARVYGENRPHERDLQLSLELQEAVTLGEPIRLQVTYTNRGRVPFFVKRGGAFGVKGELEIFADRAGCRTAVPATYFESSPPTGPSFTRLEPGGIHRETVVLNGEGGAMRLPLGVAGEYEFFVRFESRADDPLHRPLWNGTAESTWRRVTVRPPAKETLVARRHALDRCLEADCALLEGATDYFSIVRDPEASERLARLFTQRPSVAPALLTQARKQDLPALRAHVARHVVPAGRDYYLRALGRIERDDPCL